MPADSYNPASIPDRHHNHKNGQVDCGKHCTFKQWLNALPKKDWYYFGTTISVFTIISIIVFTDLEDPLSENIYKYVSLASDWIQNMIGF